VISSHGKSVNIELVLSHALHSHYGMCLCVRKHMLSFCILCSFVIIVIISMPACSYGLWCKLAISSTELISHICELFSNLFAVLNSGNCITSFVL